MNIKICHNGSWPVFLLLTGLLLFGCNSEKTVYESYEKFEKASWNRFNTLTFEVHVENIDQEYDIYLHVRHIPQVPYKDLPINFTIFTPAGDMRSVDYVIDLRDVDGKLLSDCLGDLCDLRQLLRSEFRFSEIGTARIEIENKFTKVEMPGILEIGLIVKESRKQKQE